MKLIILNFIYNLFIKYYNYVSSLIEPSPMWDVYPFMSKILMWKIWEKCDNHPLNKESTKQMIKDIKENLGLDPIRKF